jgi:hypothetical protein
MSHATSGMPAHPVVLDWRHGSIGPLAPCVLCGTPHCAGPRSRACPVTRAAPRPGSPPTRVAHLRSPG